MALRRAGVVRLRVGGAAQTVRTFACEDLGHGFAVCGVVRLRVGGVAQTVRTFACEDLGHGFAVCRVVRVRGVRGCVGARLRGLVRRGILLARIWGMALRRAGLCGCAWVARQFLLTYKAINGIIFNKNFMRAEIAIINNIYTFNTHLCF